MTDPRDTAAEAFERIAGELDRAAYHARVSAGHYRDKDIPRAGAHTTALYGHLENAQSLLRERVKAAASFASNPLDHPDASG